MKHESAPKFKHGKENGKNYCHKFINSTVQEMTKKNVNSCCILLNMHLGRFG